jgi:hypothetical protein
VGVKFTALGAAALLLSTAAVAQIQPDWRVIASTPDTVLFCDMSRVRKMPDGHVQVWTKGLPAKDLVREESSKPITKEQTSAAAEKLIHGYKPLVQSTHELTQDELINFILAEQIADAGKIQPSIRMLFEIDCEEQQYRVLSVQNLRNGKFESSDNPSGWSHIAPETNSEGVMLAVCPRS